MIEREYMETLIYYAQIAQIVNVFVVPVSALLLGIAAIKYIVK